MRGGLIVLFEAGGWAGCAYLVFAAWLVGRRLVRGVPFQAAGQRSGVTILKPLHGVAPLLYEALASFCRQNYSGPTQIVFGVANVQDPALDVARRLQTEFGADRVDIVIDTKVCGTNPKMANLKNMIGTARHDMLVLADSDILVEPDYLDRLVCAFEAKNTGAVTCLYDGLAGAGLWSRLSAGAIDMHFLPSVLVGMALGRAHPCFGSTIVLSRKTLEEIGGFTRFLDYLADDYAIGAAVRETGRDVVLCPMAVTHICEEASFGALVRHELRWARTVRSIDPVGFAGSILTHPFALALIAMALGAGWSAVVLALVALFFRFVLWARLDAVLGRAPSPYWLIPLRSCLSFLVYAVAYLGRRIDWQDRRYALEMDGTLSPVGKSTS